ncbi:MAG: UPF0175 family protein [Bacteroidia bacterium]
MIIELSDSILRNAQMSEENIKLLFAIFLFKEEFLTLGQAAELAKLPQAIFQKELGKRKIAVHYGVDEFRQDMKNISHTGWLL